MKYFGILVSLFLILPLRIEAKDAACSSKQYLVRAHHRSGYTTRSGIVVRPTNVKSYCKERTIGYDFFAERLRTGLPEGWPNKSELPGVWNEAEKERIIDVLDDLPEELLRQNVSGFYRLKKSKDYPNPASNLDGKIIAFYDSAFEPTMPLGKIISHELSHLNYLELKESDRLDYSRTAGWDYSDEGSRGKFYWVRKGEVVQKDGKISRLEDYSNNLEYFLYDPDKLKTVSPGAFNWFKKHFGEKFRLKGAIK